MRLLNRGYRMMPWWFWLALATLLAACSLGNYLSSIDPVTSIPSRARYRSQYYAVMAVALTGLAARKALRDRRWRTIQRERWKCPANR